jgi:hypothetical protein
MEPNFIFAFLFCDCIYESNYRVISLHRTKKGAYQEMNQYINNLYSEWNEERIQKGKQHSEEKWCTMQSWKITKYSILD